VIGWMLVTTALACAAGSVLAGGDLFVPLRDPRALALVFVTGIVAAGVPSVLFLVGIRSIGGTRAGILMLIEPLVGVTLAGLVLHERLEPVQGLGGAAILVAAVLLQRTAPGGEIEPAGVPVLEEA
jgi:drug/metabolite transporter (DMT)-like permease